MAEFRRFLDANPDVKKAFEAGGGAAKFLTKYSPDEDGPIILVDW